MDDSNSDASVCQTAVPIGPQRSKVAAVAVLALSALVVFGGVSAMRIYNQIVEMEHDVDTQWKHVEVQLLRQHELIPQLLEVVKGFVAYESEAIQTVVNARKEYMTAPVETQPATGSDMSAALSHLLVVSESYPDLRADSHFRDLSYEIAGTKNRIAVARMRYNEIVGAYNATLEKQPYALFAGSRGSREYFTVEAEKLTEPEIVF